MLRSLFLLGPGLAVLAACGDAAPETDADQDGVPTDQDCDDDDPDVGAASQWFVDADGDGQPGDQETLTACAPPAGGGALATDCDDANAAVYPGAPEVCDGVDNDCNGRTDDQDPDLDTGTQSVFYEDKDGDGYGTPILTATACAAPEGYAAQSGDCDDEDPELHPETAWYADNDGDGFGDPDAMTPACEVPEGHVAGAGDCDDTEPAVFPDAPELCDGIDNDCDDLVDDEDDLHPDAGGDWYSDADQDGYGNDASHLQACEDQPEMVNSGGDCDDANEDVNPGEVEICSDGVDQDCDGLPGHCGVEGRFLVSEADAHWRGEANSDTTSRGLRTVGDLDGDGTIDVLVGASQANPNGGNSGSVYLVYGSASPAAELDLASGPRFDGIAAQDLLGRGVAGGADVDGDGLADLAMGAMWAEDEIEDAGAAYLFFGSGSGWSGAQTVDGADVVIWGVAEGDGFGAELRMGDLDGDGLGDLLVGGESIDQEIGNEGAVYFLYGATSLSTEVDAADLPGVFGAATNDYLGSEHSIAVGDLDGDGWTDLALGAHRADVAGVDDLGQVHLFSGVGRTDAWTDASDADHIMTGDALATDDQRFGQAVCMPGDVDGDGTDDLAVGAYYADVGGDKSGSVYVFLGSSAGWADEAGGADVEIVGDGTRHYLGHDLAGGDVNGDGTADLFMGAYGWDGDIAQVGAVMGLMGGSGLGGVLAIADLDSIIGGEAQYMAVGYSVAVGDVDGSGQDDLLVGTLVDDDDAGGVYLFLGEQY